MKSNKKAGERLEDKDMITLILDKNEEGLAALKETYDQYLFYVAKGILGNHPDEIEECLSDVYFRLWDCQAAFYEESRSSLKTYLSVMIRSNALNRLKVLYRTSSRTEFMNDTEFSDLAKTFVDQTANVEEEVIRREEYECIRRCLSKMKEKDKELFVRRYFYLQSSALIAEEMRMSVAAVDNRLSRLRKRFKSFYEGGVNYDMEFGRQHGGY